MSLQDYIINHCKRGACQCGRCIDAIKDPAHHQPTGHTADLIFFKVAAKDNPNPDELRKLLAETKGEFGDVNLLDGNEHNYIEVGGLVGDQGLALMLMGLGSILGLWELITPRFLSTELGLPISEDDIMNMAQKGLITIKATND